MGEFSVYATATARRLGEDEKWRETHTFKGDTFLAKWYNGRPKYNEKLKDVYGNPHPAPELPLTKIRLKGPSLN